MYDTFAYLQLFGKYTEKEKEMKKMKKLITLLISLTMIFALCACGQTAEPKT